MNKHNYNDIVSFLEYELRDCRLVASIAKDELRSIAKDNYNKDHEDHWLKIRRGQIEKAIQYRSAISVLKKLMSEKYVIVSVASIEEAVSKDGYEHVIGLLMEAGLPY